MSTMDAINELSLASMTQWGVRIHSDHLWELQHNLLVAHNPSKNIVVENRLIGIENVAELLINEVHDNLVDQKLVPSPMGLQPIYHKHLIKFKE